jgi:hypothetical protein
MAQVFAFCGNTLHEREGGKYPAEIIAASVLYFLCYSPIFARIHDLRPKRYARLRTQNRQPECPPCYVPPRYILPRCTQSE